MGRSQEKASSAVLLRMLHEDEKLLAAAEKNRCGESLEALASRFATTAATADKAFAQMRMDLEYREKHDLLALAERPARQLFPSPIAQNTYMTQLPHGLLGRDYSGRPVLYKNVGRCHFASLQKSGNDFATCLRYNEWLTERCSFSLEHRGQWTVIVDLRLR